MIGRGPDQRRTGESDDQIARRPALAQPGRNRIGRRPAGLTDGSGAVFHLGREEALTRRRGDTEEHMAEKRFLVRLRDGSTQSVTAERGDEDEEQDGYLFFIDSNGGLAALFHKEIVESWQAKDNSGGAAEVHEL